MLCSKLAATQLEELTAAIAPPDQTPSRAPFDELIQNMKNEEREKEEKQKAEDLKRSMFYNFKNKYILMGMNRARAESPMD